MARGIAAAEAVFEQAGITALQGADDLFALEGWDIKGFLQDDKPTDDEDSAATVCHPSRPRICGVEFIAENGGGDGVRLRKS